MADDPLAWLPTHWAGPRLRDYPNPRPTIPLADCPSLGCSARWRAPLLLMSALQCSECGANFRLDDRSVPVLLDRAEPEAAAAVAAPSLPPQPDPDLDPGPTESRGVRAAAADWNEWRLAAQRAGMSLSSWLARAGRDAAALEEAAHNHPERKDDD